MIDLTQPAGEEPAWMRIGLPPYRSIARVTPEFAIYCTGPPPNPWHRFWYWALLGWKWERMP
jgi:hypothetical protein